MGRGGGGEKIGRGGGGRAITIVIPKVNEVVALAVEEKATNNRNRKK